MPRKIVIVKWICEMCGMSFFDEPTTTTHEEHYCFKNPRADMIMKSNPKLITAATAQKEPKEMRTE